MRSEVFDVMFYGALADTKGVVDIVDIDSACMKQIIRFIYTDKPSIRDTNVIGVLYGANKYGLQPLVKKCSTFLEINMNVNDVCMVHQQASMYYMHELQDKCFKFMLHNATRIFKTEAFLQTTPDTLISLLKSEDLPTEEIQVFRAAMKWSEQRCKENNKDITGNNMRQYLGSALLHIRFPLIPKDVFVNEVGPSGLLTKGEEIELYRYFLTYRPNKHFQFVTRQRKFPKTYNRMEQYYSTEQVCRRRYRADDTKIIRHWYYLPLVLLVVLMALILYNYISYDPDYESDLL